MTLMIHDFSLETLSLRLAKNEIGSPEMKGPGRGKEREV
jgi:hypothetical protein